MNVVTDASVIVKWFKKGEPKEELALALRDKMLAHELSITCNEWSILEVVRAVMKVNFPVDKVKEIVSILSELESEGFIRVIRVYDVRKEAADLIHALNLYASDAVVLATALHTKSTLVTEDHHLLKDPIKKFAREHKVEIKDLEQFLSEGTPSGGG